MGMMRYIVKHPEKGYLTMICEGDKMVFAYGPRESAIKYSSITKMLSLVEKHPDVEELNWERI